MKETECKNEKGNSSQITMEIWESLVVDRNVPLVYNGLTKCSDRPIRGCAKEVRYYTEIVGQCLAGGCGVARSGVCA